MKYLIASCAMLLFVVKANAQSSVVAAAESGTAADVSVDWTVGDVVYESATFIVTGDIKEEKENPSVYPIPFENEFVIEPRESNSAVEFSLFDASGRTVKTTFTTEGSIYHVNASELTSGLYMLVIKKSNTNVSQVFKIIKK